MVDWKPYLESICEKYAQWWDTYTLTNVVGNKFDKKVRKSPLLDLQAIALKPEREEFLEAREVFNVLEGLRKYAPEHVLLSGRPGSGKSTALVRLLLESAEKTSPQTPLRSGEGLKNAPPSLVGKGVGGLGQIPVLVELRYYETSILDLITAFLHRHDPSLTIDCETIKTLLRQGQFLLLVDGVNELPSPEAQRNLQKFRQDYEQTTPMVFTTRDLGVGGDLGVSKKLEMQPLTETQMEEFVRGYLPETGEQMLQQLGGRLREFGETPLLLMMLCSVFASNGNQIPPNLGSVFRRFTEIYDGQLKQDIPVTDESRRWWKRLLQHLAWVMMTSPQTPLRRGEGLNQAPPSLGGKGVGGLGQNAKTEFLVAIPRQQAEEIFTEYLEGKVNCAADCAISWLNDLLKHHLIQIGAENKIEFRHQLIQEYYAAERFLQEVGKLSDDELQWDYLNYLKWTEPAALMLGLLDDEGLAVRVVRLALQVDWQLGARLAGEVKLEWQEKTVGLIESLNIPLLLKIRLLRKTKLYMIVSNVRFSSGFPAKYLAEIIELIKLIDADESLLGIIKSDTAIPKLIKLLDSENSDVRSSAASALVEIKSEAAMISLVNILNDQNFRQTNNGKYALNALNALEEIQEHLKYYKPTPIRTMSNILSHNYALLIGVGECEEPKLSLPVTVKDIQAIKTLLTDQNLCGYIDNDRHLRLLYNTTATSENILDGLNWLKQQAENDPEATIFIYYSGHGCLDDSGDYYLIPHESDRVDIPNTALPATKFNAALQQIPAQRLLVIIDSCHAQGMASSKEGANNRPPLPKGFTQTALPKNIIDELKQGTGRVVFTSSTGNQLSWVRPDGKMSVYTYHLLEALQGAANQAGDKVVRVSHLMNYLGKTIKESARDLCKAEQTPFFDFATEDFAVALLHGGKGLATEGWDKQKAEEKIHGIYNNLAVNNSDVGNIVNVIGGNNNFGGISSSKGK